MSLKDFVIHKEPVTFRGVVLAEVRGLALNDVTILIRGHLNELKKLFDLYDNEATRQTAMSEAARYAITILQEAPELAATMIALACDEPDQVAKAACLPLPVQVELVRKIIGVTFEEAGGAKKFLDSVVSMASGLISIPNIETD